MDLNKAMIIGRLTRDPESRTTPQGQKVTTFSLATNRAWNDAEGKKQESVEFHNIVAWGKLAEIIEKYLAKGRRIFIEGRLQTRGWQAQDGSKRSRTEITAENMIMLDGKRDGAPGESGGSGVSEQTPSEEPPVEDIPF